MRHFRVFLMIALATIAGLALVARHGAAPASQAEQDRIDAKIMDAKISREQAPSPSMPVERQSLIACLRTAGFAVHSGDDQTLLVSRRGLTGTPLRIVDGGNPSVAPDAWGSVNNVVFGSLGAATQDTRRAFFGCVDPHATP